jgi:hypothetical protein
MPLLWFHAFRRPTIHEIVEVLRVGSSPPPAGVVTDTRALEERLGLKPNVYAYLGRTLECFGDAAFAVSLEAASGHLLSPFDTGGLVNKIKPVCDWADDLRRKYLTALTWDFSERESVFRAYPGTTIEQVRTYLAEARPPHPGPHGYWNRKPIASIWSDNHDWRAWTWECRTERQLATADHIIRWSCSLPIYQQLLEFSETVTEPSFQDWLEEVFTKYVDGGVSRLIRALREHQEMVA